MSTRQNEGLGAGDKFGRFEKDSSNSGGSQLHVFTLSDKVTVVAETLKSSLTS